MKQPIKFLVLIFIFLSLSLPVWGEANFTPKKGVVLVSRVNFRNAPDLSGEVITSLVNNTEVTILEEHDSWYKIKLNDSREGWVAKKYIKTVLSSSNSRGLGYYDLISYAKNFLKTNYRFGGTSPAGFDCSGFTQYIFAKFGYQIPHSSAGQMSIGTAVSKLNLQPTDLLFFWTRNRNQVGHVGIYIGDNQFIHAASGYGAVRISNLNEPYYQKRYLGARRIVNYPVCNAQIVKDEPQSTHSFIKEFENFKSENVQQVKISSQNLQPQTGQPVETQSQNQQSQTVKPVEAQIQNQQPQPGQSAETQSQYQETQTSQPEETKIPN